MFGKPEWFKTKAAGCCGLAPAKWQGWAYYLIWLGAMIGPFALLQSQSKSWQSVIWLMASVAAAVWDVRSVVKEKRAVVEEELFVIDENETESKRMATENYDLHITE